MNKLWLILKREYWTRVRKKSFILVTILTPLGIGLLIFISAYFSSQVGKSEQNIVVKDENNIIDKYPIKSKTSTFTITSKHLDSVKTDYIKEGFDVFLHIPKVDDFSQKDFDVNFYSKEKLGFITIESMEKKIAESFKKFKLENSNIDKEAYDKLKTNITLENALTGTGEESLEGDRSSKFSSGISMAMAYIMGFLMYMVIFIFGQQIMRSVTEEKINRVVEIMVSTVKPFQLMMGKLLGVGLVGLTQLGIWMILIPIIGIGASMYFGTSMSNSAEIQQATEMARQLQENGDINFMKIMEEIQSFNWFLIIPTFIVFFLGGFFIYSSLFAAVGSAVGEDMAEAQQFMLPISIPVIIAFLMIPLIISEPNGKWSIFGSMFPLFSPILMPARLAFDPPLWQIITSIIILLLSVAFFVWVSAKIYRVGIFMYGKKVSFKELYKWIFYKY